MKKVFKEVESALELIPIDFGGGCPLHKANMIAGLIVRNGLGTSLDIGVYRGRSFFAMAIAHSLTGGIAYGVDPWSRKECKQYDRPDLEATMDEFIENTDFEDIYESVVEIQNRLGLDSCSRILRMRLDAAISVFEEDDIYFDLVHIDGNHDTALVSSDYEMYVPRIRSKGFLVLDDISWDSIRPTFELASSEMALLYEGDDYLHDYAIYQRAEPGRGTRKLSRWLNRLEKV